MNLDEIRTFCLSLNGVTEDLPFDEDTLAFRIGGKIFLLTSLSDPSSVNLKCDPELAVQLRDQFPGDVLPGYHMNKKHWNTVKVTGKPDQTAIFSMILQSYHLVLKSLPASIRKNYA